MVRKTPTPRYTGDSVQRGGMPWESSDSAVQFPDVVNSKMIRNRGDMCFRVGRAVASMAPYRKFFSFDVGRRRSTRRSWTLSG